MKSIYKILAILLILVGASCKKELYKEPIGELTPDQINTDPKLSTVTYSVSSSYQLLSSTLNILGNWRWDDGTVTRNDFVLQDMASGDVQKKWNPDGDQPWMDDIASFNFTPGNAAFNGQWSYDYEGITRANLAISYLTDMDVVAKVGLNEALRVRLLGEVYFLRAFYYFDLVNNFGGVPLLLKPLKNFQDAYAVAKRESAENVWAQISSDLTNAKGLLPNSKFSSDSERWRASKGAVMALQAKVALYNQKWADVVSIINEMETLNFYDLNTNYFDNFRVESEFTDKEVIFAFDHQSGKTPPAGNGLCALLDWGFIAPTANFLAEFETNDPRLLYTVNVPDHNVNKILGTLNGTHKGNEDAPGNKIYIRWADVLLWKAEALNETGSTGDAIILINRIRARARNTVIATGGTPPAGTLPDRPVSTDKAQIKNWLIHERRVELGFEGQRFLDLKRWKMAKQVLSALGKNFQDYNYLYPIPQGEVSNSGGTITQNPNY
ncbi:MAG: RagB/SusD family nutrient uptake outer membrane protein [Candidatus Pedobacter colombiensis]|uniref:RagB/SusD family nutrient uptake outer membrane protein n=1 Tax=Candidatus Pedobacter colombiensis TaxID=3121371 RepID=A0AAJ6B8Z0_9SPHI|nr:RagB/SusD family nutrient uptake outer membrane protein [Pedobacter sp.]WEK19638.1 MAG: RagB/SusD family nutrient uptake outer membrane protein [Pedobacter sp.]